MSRRIKLASGSEVNFISVGSKMGGLAPESWNGVDANPGKVRQFLQRGKRFLMQAQ